MSHHQRAGICFQYNKSGTCRFGSNCKFSHKKPKKVVSSGPFIQSSKRSGKALNAKRRRQTASADHIDRFFAKHPDFDYDQSAPIWVEFNRMRDEFEWDSDDYEFREARRNFKSAMVQQFNSLYGTDEDNLSSWQNLCHILNIQPVPERLRDCRERVRQTHVNLVDLVDTPRTGRPVKVFPNLKSLRDYTIKTEKYFPKEDAYAGGLLRFLLREILHPKTA